MTMAAMVDFDKARLEIAQQRGLEETLDDDEAQERYADILEEAQEEELLMMG